MKRSSGHSSAECVAQREGGNGGDYEALGEEEKEDVAQEWPEWGDDDEDEKEDVYLGNRGFDELLSTERLSTDVCNGADGQNVPIGLRPACPDTTHGLDYAPSSSHCSAFDSTTFATAAATIVWNDMTSLELRRPRHTRNEI